MKFKFSNILLVDDDDITNFINEEIINEMRITPTVISVNDGKDALEYIQTNWQKDGTAELPRLILLDINMQNMDGFEMLKRMPQIEQVYIAILTTSEHSRDKTLASEFQVNSYIEKPLTVDKIKTLLKKLSL